MTSNDPVYVYGPWLQYHMQISPLVENTIRDEKTLRNNVLPKLTFLTISLSTQQCTITQKLI
jgi:hypothetical protein